MNKIELTREELTNILQVATGNVKDFVMDNDKFIDEQLKAINYTHCCKSDSELLKSVSRLDYSAWKDKLGLIKDVDKGLYKLNGNYITINEVLDMYDVYCDTF